jgi:DNA-binding NarL/FixJ family response regulator
MNPVGEPAAVHPQRHIRVLIVDRQPITRDALTQLLESDPAIHVVGTAPDLNEAARLAATLTPDIALIDTSLGGRSGLDALRAAVVPPTTRIIVFTATMTEDQIASAIQLGARGILLKQSSTRMLFDAIRAVSIGAYWLGGNEHGDVFRALRDTSSGRKKSGRFGLTDRELQLVSAVVAGYTNADIAAKLAIRPKTVKHHLTNIFDKVGVSTRLELALFALHHDLETIECDDDAMVT